ncbi:MAG TPA: DegT/DnrJ/EryC1/StrS family aminotransferase [Phycisphaerales bacterium]|nr:DegT/DnrJ/EryC1/StrS family aminotransferase [Phycisphaerales bacterium]
MATTVNATRPAILGGPRAVTLDGREANRWPIFTSEDEAAVLSIMRDGDLSLHPVARELEDDYRRYFGVKHALSHCNGTSALMAAFFALGLEPGSEVLVPTATFWATVVPMMWCGLVPVFCESEPVRLGIDPDDAAKKITPRTRAIVVVHLFGMPSRMTELLALASKHNLRVIEDASHAHGAQWRGRNIGALGDIAVFSMQGHKLAPAGEGGMFLTNDGALMERATCFGDMVRVMELNTPAARFAGTTFGIKTRIASLSAAIARVQMRHLDERSARRKENLLYLSDRLDKLGFETFRGPAHVNRVYFEYLVRYDAARWGLDREKLIAALRAEGCEAGFPRYPLVHQQPLFTEGAYREIPAMRGLTNIPKYEAADLPRTHAMNEQMLKLPVFPSATRPLLDQYAEAFEKVLNHSREIAAAGGAA